MGGELSAIATDFGYNKNGPAGAGNTLRSLTRSSGTSREGLGMKPTRQAHGAPLCIATGCNRATIARGMCLMHYKRWRRWGDPNIRRPIPDPAEKFRSLVAVGGAPSARPGLGDCHNWTGTKLPNGYGFFRVGSIQALAHRWAYEQTRGPIPTGLVIDHLCRNRACVNPDHLEPVTNAENLRRGAGYALQNGMRDKCRNGHTYTQENTYTDPTKGTVRCRECARIRDRKRRNRKATS